MGCAESKPQPPPAAHKPKQPPPARAQTQKAAAAVPQDAPAPAAENEDDARQLPAESEGKDAEVTASPAKKDDPPPQQERDAACVPEPAAPAAANDTPHAPAAYENLSETTTNDSAESGSGSGHHMASQQTILSDFEVFDLSTVLDPVDWSQKQMVALLQHVQARSRMMSSVRMFARWAPYQLRFEHYALVDAMRQLDKTDEMWAMSDSEDEGDDKSEMSSDMKCSTGLHNARVAPDDFESANVIIDNLRNRKQLPAASHYRYLLHTATDICLDYSPVHHISIPEDCRLVVVGDLHGQLDDLLWILKEGLPGPNLMYLFNGDFVDRGSEQMEVLALLVALKAKYPNRVFMNRGNHEEHRVNKRGKDGFLEQCARHYGERMYKQTHTFFKALPLCHVINKKVFVVHGGLPLDEDVTLDEIDKIERFRECPCSQNKGRSPPDTREDRIFQSMLWADPKDMDERGMHSPRGAGALFGPEVTKEFLSNNSLDLIIRSHELTVQGSHVLHDGKCLTVFSASRYCGKDDNLGSYLVLMPDLEMSVHWYYVRAGQVSSLMSKIGRDAKIDDEELMQCMTQYSFAEHTSLKTSVLSRIGQLVMLKRGQLLQMFQTKDHRRTGTVPKKSWVKVMRVMFGDLPWWSLSRHLATPEVDGSIHYMRFLNRFQVKLAAKWMSAWAQKVMRYGGHIVLKCAEGLRRNLDAHSKTGKLTYYQLSRAIREVMPSLDNIHVYYLVAYLDDNGDGFVDFDEWDQHVEKTNVPGALPGVLALWNLQHTRTNVYDKVMKALTHGAEGAGAVDKHTFVDVCLEEKMSMGCERETWELTAGSLAGEDGLVSLNVLGEHVAALDEDFHRAQVIMGIIDSLSAAQGQIMKVFDALDADGSGTLSPDEFVQGLQELGMVETASERDKRRLVRKAGRDVNTKDVISIDGALALYAVADVDGDNSLTLDEFMKALLPRDTWADDVDSPLSSKPQGRRMQFEDQHQQQPQPQPQQQQQQPATSPPLREGSARIVRGGSKPVALAPRHADPSAAK